MKIKNKKIIITLLFVTIIVTIFLACTYKNEYYSNYSEIEYNNTLPDNFAVYLDGVRSYSSTYPEPALYKYSDGSCSGDGMLTYNFVTHKVELDATESVKCNLYYTSIENSLVGSIIEEAKTTKDNTTYKVADLTADNLGYRYQGSDANTPNYICIGTQDKTTCLSDESYIYRIIGAEEREYSNTLDQKTQSTGYMTKVIGIEYQDAQNRNLNWTTGVASTQKSIYGNMDKKTKTMLANAKFYVSGTTTSFGTTTKGLQAANAERFSLGIKYQSIGLMSSHDIVFSALDPSSSVNCSEKVVFSSTGWGKYCLDTSWIFPDSSITEWIQTVKTTPTSTTAIAAYYWTGTRVYIKTNTASTNSTVSYQYRNVLYLKPETTIISGTGTASDPYIVDYENLHNGELLVKQNMYEANLGDENLGYRSNRDDRIDKSYFCFNETAVSSGSCSAGTGGVFALGLVKVKYASGQKGNNIIDKSDYLLQMKSYINHIETTVNTAWPDSNANVLLNTEPITFLDYQDEIVNAYWHTGGINANQTMNDNDGIKISDILYQEINKKRYDSDTLGYVGKFGIVSLSDVISTLNVSLQHDSNAADLFVTGDSLLTLSNWKNISYGHWASGMRSAIMYAGNRYTETKYLLSTGNSNVAGNYYISVDYDDDENPYRIYFSPYDNSTYDISPVFYINKDVPILSYGNTYYYLSS